MSLSSPVQVALDTQVRCHLSPYRVPAGAPTRRRSGPAWSDRAQAVGTMRLCAPPATRHVLARDPCETPAVTALIPRSRIGVRMRPHWRPGGVSYETPPGTHTQTSPPRAPCATPGATVRALARHREDVRRNPRGIPSSVGVLCVSRACLDETPLRHERGGVSPLFHGTQKHVCAPCRSLSAGTAAQPRNAGGARSAQPSARWWHIAGATVGTGASSGRHGRAGRAEGEGAKGEQFLARSERAGACFRGKGPWG